MFGSAKHVLVVKQGLDSQGLYGGPVCEPLVELSAADRDRVERYIDRLADVDSSERGQH